MTKICVALTYPPIGTKPNSEDIEAAKKWIAEQGFEVFEPDYETCVNRRAARIAQRRKKNEKLRFRRARARLRKKLAALPRTTSSSVSDAIFDEALLLYQKTLIYGSVTVGDFKGAVDRIVSTYRDGKEDK